jgi:hypothetical protein
MKRGLEPGGRGISIVGAVTRKRLVITFRVVLLRSYKQGTSSELSQSMKRGFEPGGRGISIVGAVTRKRLVITFRVVLLRSYKQGTSSELSQEYSLLEPLPSNV